MPLSLSETETLQTLLITSSTRQGRISRHRPPPLDLATFFVLLRLHTLIHSIDKPHTHESKLPCRFLGLSYLSRWSTTTESSPSLALNNYAAYYGNFVSNMACRIHSVTASFLKSATIEFTFSLEDTICRPSRGIHSTADLVFPDWGAVSSKNQPFFLHCYVNTAGFAATLEQEQRDSCQ